MCSACCMEGPAPVVSCLRSQHPCSVRAGSEEEGFRLTRDIVIAVVDIHNLVCHIIGKADGWMRRCR